MSAQSRRSSRRLETIMRQSQSLLSETHRVSDLNSETTADITQDMDRYKSYCKVLGYMSKIQTYEESANIVLSELGAFQISILNRHGTAIHPDLLRQLVIPIQQNRWFNKGKSNYECIRNRLIEAFRKKIERCIHRMESHPHSDEVAMVHEGTHTDSPNYKSLEAIILNIISMDTFYDIYESVIDYMAERNHTLRHIIYNHFGEHVFI